MSRLLAAPLVAALLGGIAVAKDLPTKVVLTLGAAARIAAAEHRD